jgi:3-hydroxyacyl-[acyl-carrier-protein] dehydratase
LNPLDIHEVIKYLPHRYPFLLIDRVLDYVPDQSLTAIKNVTINEHFFTGHFPGRPVMPGVLILESMAQASALLSLKSMEKLPNEDSVFYFVGIDDVRFRRPVEPGDQLRVHSTFKRQMRSMWMYECTAHVGEDLAVSASLMCTYRSVKQ